MTWFLRMAMAAALGALLGACAKTAPGAAGIGEPCLLNGDCAAGFLCAASRCALPANLGGCEPGAKRCNGADVEACRADALGWDTLQTCPTGCSAAACRPLVCTPGELRCSGDASEACAPAGDAWALVQVCATHCNPETGRCRSPACAPFSARCDPSGAANVWVCDAYGSGYQVTACAAGEACAAGACQSTSANCKPGDLRCNGQDVQRCEAGAAGSTQWKAQGTCLGGCSAGACGPGGSCAGVKLQAAVQAPPADGVSQLLVYSDPIAGLDGLPLPDGKLFTVTASSAGANAPAVLSPDADPVRAGVQVRSAGGRVAFVVRAPAAGAADAAGTFTAALAEGGSCAASAGATFSVAPASGVLVAEEFKSALRRNPAATTADWNVERGALVAASPVDPGNGADGDLSVAAGSTLDLSAQSGLMPAWAVTSLSGATVTVAGNAAGLSGGDEVLLWDAQGLAGQSTNAGAFETARVLAVSGPTVTLAAPPRGTYGVAGDQNVAAQRVVLQRVPRLATLTVAAGGVLTAKGWDGTTGGVLFLRVKGTARVQGTLSMDGRGFRGASGGAAAGEDLSGRPGAPATGGGGPACGGGHGSAGFCGTGGSLPGAPVGAPLLPKLLLGAGGGPGAGAAGGAGGGAVVIAAETLRFDFDADGSPFQGRVSADGAASAGDGGGGAGGTLWLQARLLVLGAEPIAGGSLNARGFGSAGGGAGGSGRIRVDYLATDRAGVGAACARTAPACALGQAGPLAAQSLDAYLATGALVRQATLLLALSPGPGAPAGAEFFASASAADPPDFSPPLVLGTPTDFVPPPGSPLLGGRFRWRVEVRPPAGPPQLLLGLQWALKVN